MEWQLWCFYETKISSVSLQLEISLNPFFSGSNIKIPCPVCSNSPVDWRNFGVAPRHPWRWEMVRLSLQLISFVDVHELKKRTWEFWLVSHCIGSKWCTDSANRFICPSSSQSRRGDGLHKTAFSKLDLETCRSGPFKLESWTADVKPEGLRVCSGCFDFIWSSCPTSACFGGKSNVSTVCICKWLTVCSEKLFAFRKTT